MGIIGINTRLVVGVCLLGLVLSALPLVASQGSFTITTAPSSLSIGQRGQGTSTITTTVSGGFNSSISLSASGAPLGVAVSFNPTTIGAPGSGQSAMTISVMRITTLGTYPITVTGNGGGIKQTVVVTLMVTAPGSFTISASPSSLTIPQGNQGISTITVTVSGGFNNSISLTASGQPSNTTVSFNPTTIPAPGSGSSIMTITVGSNTPAGTYPITVTGGGGGIKQTTVVTLTVTSQGGKNFTISASPSSLSIVQGNQGTSTITTTISGGFNSPIYLVTSGVLPLGTTVTFNPSTIPAPGSGNSTMTVSLLGMANPGTYPITVKGIGGGIQQPVTVTLTIVAAPNFSLSASPKSLTVMQTNQGTSTITTTVSNGFNNPINLSASGQPSGTSVTYNPPTIPAPGSGSSTMSVNVSMTTLPGNYTITVGGSGGGLQRYTIVTLTVTAAPNALINTWPSALSVAQGNQATSNITTTVCCGFNSAITLSAAGAPSNTTVNLNPTTIPAPGAGNSVATISVSSTTPTGIYTITFSGSGGGILRNVTLTLNVTGGQPPPNAKFEEAYSYALQSSFDKPPYTYQLTSGALPPGLSMDHSGNITGTPTTLGQYNFSVLATDSSQNQQSSSYPLNVVIGLDTYSGLTAAPVPGCNASGYFQLLKIAVSGGNNRWVLADPDCNAFYQLSLYFADSTYILPQIMQQRYGNDKSLWATHTINRMQAYGYNAVDIFYSTYMLPVGTWNSQNGATPQIPFALYNPASVDVRQNIQDAGIPEPIKDICAGLDGSGYTGWCGYTLDIFDPKWQTANTNVLNNLVNTVFTNGFADSPWVIAISLGDAANLATLTGNGSGLNHGAEYPHTGALAAITNFTQTTYSGGTYQDTNVYSKLAWVAYLQGKYNNSIAALNSAWNTGGFYTAFGDAGGFGTGTGVLDEDGRHTQWFGSDFINLNGMNSNLQDDVNQFLYNFTIQAYGVQASTFRTYDTNHLFVCGTFGGTGDGGTRPQVLQGLRDAGCNIQVWNWNSNYPSGSLAVNQQSYGIANTPAIIMYPITAQADSDMSAYPQNGSSDGDFPTQNIRGAHNISDQAALLQAQGSNGDYYMVGSTAWALTDDPNQLTNWGIVSLSDNSYDGTCAVIAAGIDQWGYACGGEAANYGNYTGGVAQANSNTLQQLILQMKQH